MQKIPSKRISHTQTTSTQQLPALGLPKPIQSRQSNHQETETRKYPAQNLSGAAISLLVSQLTEGIQKLQ